MVNQEIILLMKRRIDELTDDELIIIKEYCDQKVLQWDNRNRPSYQNGIGVEMVRRMISMASR